MLCLSSPSFANGIDLFLAGGGTYSSLTNGDTDVVFNDNVTSQFQTDEANVWNVLGGLGVGYTIPFKQYFSTSFYLSGYVVGLGDVEGIEHPFINAGDDFDTLNYQFKVNSYTVMLESRLAITRYPLQPYILAGIGVAWNKLFDFEEEPTNPNGSAAPLPEGFADHTQTSFAYQFGVGLQYNFLQGDAGQCTWQISLDYRYMNMGEGSLGTVPGQTTNETLKVSNIDTQALVLTLHFVT
jgi:opacity protein-like surface antigen